MSDLNSEHSKEKYFYNKYRDKVRFAGAKHSSIKYVSNLLKNKSSSNKLFLADSLWSVEKVQLYNLEIEMFIFCPEMIYSEEATKVTDYLINKSKESYIVSKKVFMKISEKDNTNGLLAVCKMPHYSLDTIKLKENCILIILDGIEMPGNIGTIIRSVDGAGGDGVIVCNSKARLIQSKVIKSSHGSIFKIPSMEVETKTLIKWLKDNEFQIYLTDTRAKKEYYEVDYSGRIAIVAGNERYGISKEWYDEDCKTISIPMFGDADSLNVSIATTIVLYEASLSQKKRRLRK
jgi:TrmH family RNA methyltransferase